MSVVCTEKSILSCIAHDVSSERYFEAVGAARVMAGWEDDPEAWTAQGGPRFCVSACFELLPSCSRKVSPSIAFLLPLPPLMTLFKLPYADWLRFLLLSAFPSCASLSLELLASGTAISVLSAADHPWLILFRRPRPTSAPVLTAQPGPVPVISPCGGRCESYSSARLILLFAQISAMASMASRISGSTARRMAEKEKSSAEGSCSLLPARPAVSAEVGMFPLTANERGVLKPEPGREVCREPEYVRTTTGWLVTVVRLDVDFADLLLEGDEWKAGALRARRAADWVGGSVLVNVVVALGTEHELAARSVGPSCASEGCAWMRIAGTASSDRMGWALSVDVVLLARRVEKTPRGTDCLVVVAGVNGCGMAFDSGASEPCWSLLGGWAEGCEGGGASKGTGGSFGGAADPDIVKVACKLQVNA